MVLVHPGGPQIGSEIGLDRRGRTDRAAEHLVHSGDDAVHVHRTQLQRLLAAEGEQLLRQTCRAMRAADRRFGQPAPGCVGCRKPRLEQFEIADDRGQQIVEIVRHPSGEAPERLDLLRLDERLLGLTALGDGARDPLFERRIEFAQARFGLLAFEQVSADLILPAARPQRARTALISVSARSGRSSSDTLPSCAKARPRS